MAKMTLNDMNHNLLEISDDTEMIESYLSDFASYSDTYFDENEIKALYDDFNQYADCTDF